MKKICAFIVIAASMLAVTAVAETAEKEKPSPALADQTVQIAHGTAVSTSSSAANLPTAGEQIKWQVISGGGTSGSSTNYKLGGTIGQTAAGLGTSTNYKVNSGYWQNYTPTSCCNVAGDANNDNSVNVGDAVFVINRVFKSGTPPVCFQKANCNGDTSLNVGDAVYLINRVFKSGPAPICGA